MSQSVSQQEPRGGDVSVNGLKLHYLDWGGDGRPIVILHATGFLGRIYRPIAEALTAIGHVYSYDQRGHGDSEHPKGRNQILQRGVGCGRKDFVLCAAPDFRERIPRGVAMPIVLHTDRVLLRRLGPEHSRDNRKRHIDTRGHPR